MKKLFVLLLASFSFACASNPHNAEYKEETNAPKFGNSRSYVEPPHTVLLAARAVLDQLIRDSDPPTSGSVKGKDETLETGWVYSVSKNRYVEFQMNGKPARKPLRIRRSYSYTVTPSLAGSQVVFGAREEVLKIDFSTGKEQGWSSVETDPKAYDYMSLLLKEKLHSL